MHYAIAASFCCRFTSQRQSSCGNNRCQAAKCQRGMNESASHYFQKHHEMLYACEWLSRNSKKRSRSSKKFVCFYVSLLINSWCFFSCVYMGSACSFSLCVGTISSILWPNKINYFTSMNCVCVYGWEREGECIVFENTCVTESKKRFYGHQN